MCKLFNSNKSTDMLLILNPSRCQYENTVYNASVMNKTTKMLHLPSIVDEVVSCQPPSVETTIWSH